jgi:curved DNA-binding protein CbpA
MTVMGVPHRDLYQLLGVDRDALRGDIAQAYRRKARAVHPDSRPDDPDAPDDFRALTEAYRVLSDPGRRAAYDRTLGSPATPRAAGPVRAADPPLWAGPVRIQGWTGEDWSW